MIVDKVTFFYKFLKSPKRVGSVTPSSPFLTHAMFKTIDWNSISSIVELGAGTGVFTRYISEMKPQNLTGIIYEQDPQMRRRLKTLYPSFHYCTYAENIYTDIQNLKLDSVDCIISGLPFANFDQVLRDRIIDGVVQSLKPGGKFIAFQYSKQMLHQLEQKFTQIDISFVPLNIPPAFVYHCTK